ncbi:hypothetical protein STEG23_016721 [Scotinomys teguina]
MVVQKGGQLGYGNGYPKQRTTAPRNGFAPKPDLQAREAERQLAQRLRDRCEWQARQLCLARGELKRAIRGFDALAVSTQHFFGKPETVTPWDVSNFSDTRKVSKPESVVKNILENMYHLEKKRGTPMLGRKPKDLPSDGENLGKG